MRYHIDTIPVWDAYKENSECPLCDLHAAQEQGYLESFLGASVMEPDVRVEVNEKGFCAHHFARMLGMQNRLGLSLMTHTHLLTVIDGMKAAAPAKNGRNGLFGHKKSAPTDEAARETCILCERLGNTMNRYLFTVLHLWRTESAFKDMLAKSKGHCQPHHESLTRMARAEMGAADAEAFLGMLSALQRENLARIERELWWFTQKFDYRNADKPWGESKDAPERAILKLRGKQG